MLTLPRLPLLILSLPAGSFVYRTLPTTARRTITEGVYPQAGTFPTALVASLRQGCGRFSLRRTGNSDIGLRSPIFLFTSTIAVGPIANIFCRRFILRVGNWLAVTFSDLGVVRFYRKILGF